MKYKNELKIGFWSIIALVVLFMGINYLKGRKLTPGQIYYLACERVDGLAVSSHVKLHGLKVGTVLSMKYDAETDKVVVAINLYDSDMTIPTDSRIWIKNDLLGTSDIVLEMGQNTEYYPDGAFIVLPEPKPGLLDKAEPIVTQIDQLLPKLDSLVSGINVLVNDSKLHESLLDVNDITTQLNRTTRQLNHLLTAEVPQLLNTVNDIACNVDTLSVQLRQADVSQVIQSATQTLAQAEAMLQQMQSQESSIGLLLNTTELHQQLTHTLADMDSLINDIKANPKRYIHIKVF